MRKLSFAVVSLALFAVAAHAEDAIPPETLAAIKAATVFVKVEVEGLSGSGSGFVVKTDGDTLTSSPTTTSSSQRSCKSSWFPAAGPAIGRHTIGSLQACACSADNSAQLHTATLGAFFTNAVVTVVFRSGTTTRNSSRRDPGGRS